MDLYDYSGLKAAIVSFVNRNDLTDAIPAFIALAEAQMNRRLRCRRMMGRSDAAMIAGDEFVKMPRPRSIKSGILLRRDCSARPVISSPILLFRRQFWEVRQLAQPRAFWKPTTRWASGFLAPEKAR
jgi:hypothetical protein